MEEIRERCVHTMVFLTTRLSCGLTHGNIHLQAGVCGTDHTHLLILIVVILIPVSSRNTIETMLCRVFQILILEG